MNGSQRLMVWLFGLFCMTTVCVLLISGYAKAADIPIEITKGVIEWHIQVFDNDLPAVSGYWVAGDDPTPLPGSEFTVAIDAQGQQRGQFTIAIAGGTGSVRVVAVSADGTASEMSTDPVHMDVPTGGLCAAAGGGVDG